ncbi:hypothetical protein ACEWY4_026692 [Coilia grayii]|uniref:G-protein coupled receptors family 1 profile domain-containing protein n=1 Tax=Coilia grayii TaxID=363190 RepID=A0ABD1IQD6_9TELE
MLVHIWSLNLSNSESFSLNQSFNESTEEPLFPLDPTGLSRTGHTVVATFLGIIMFFGFFNNLLVLLIFAKFRCLWTPINLILLNISVSDILVCIFGTPFSFAANIYGRWLIGDYGCQWYGFANSLFGIVSLVSLSILSYERHSAVLCSTKADVSDFRKAWLCVCGTWLYSLLWTLPPFLGWGRYGPEGPGTSCSVEWQRRSAGSVLYVVCLFVFCLLLPLVLMLYCYSKILLVIRGVNRVNMLSAQRRQSHILLMVLAMVSCYLLCWMPYGLMALVATFGDTGLVTPVASVVPAVLAKSSTVFNPVIYVLFNNQFYRCFVAFMNCSAEPQSINLFHLQASSREEALAAGSSPGHRKSLSLRRHSRTPLRTERRALSLVVHYTP